VRIHALIPVKDLNTTKSRLTPPFSIDERAALTIDMLMRVLAVCHASRRFARITVISPDDTVLMIAEEMGAAPLRQESTGLNPALEEGRADALARGADAILVLHADLPRLTADEIGAMLDLLPTPPAAVLAPDDTGTGTNALLLAPPDALPFHFGAGSFALHRAAAEARSLPHAVARAPGIAGDIDTPDDVRRLVASGQ
jgi:2-phospho-L-lactate/phosphoenolpyruvate guanylyltransferase